MSENKFLTEHGLDHYTSLLKDRLFNPNNGKVYTREQVDAAINEVKQLALGSKNAYSFEDYTEVYNTLLAIGHDTANSGYVPGNVFYIKDADSPNLQILNMGTAGTDYFDGTTLEQFISELENNIPVHVGYFEIAPSETAKIDFTDLVGINDYMSYENYGIGRVDSGSKEIEVENGILKSKKSGISNTTVKIGNINTGTDLSEMTAMEILQEMLAPYIAPTISNLTQSGSSVFNLLDGPKSLSALVANITKGSKPLTTDIVSGKITYNGTEVAGTLNDAKDTITFSLTKQPSLTVASSSVNFTVSIETSKGTTVSRTFTIKSIAPIIYGQSSSATIGAAELAAGTALLSESTSFTCTINDGYKFIAIPNTSGMVLSKIVNMGTGGNEYNVYTDNGESGNNYKTVTYNNVPYKVYAAGVRTNSTITYTVTLSR